MLYGLYFVLLVVMLRVYGACQFGMDRIGGLVCAQLLACLIATAGAYVVAVANARIFVNPLPLILVLAVQFVISLFFSYVGNRIYYHLNKAKRSAVVYREDSDLQKLKGIEFFDQKYYLDKYIKDPENILSILSELDGFEVVFVIGIEATERNSIAKYCIEKGIVGYMYPHTGDVIMMSGEQMQMFSIPLVCVRRADHNTEYMICKRIFDVLVSVMAILITSPLMLVTAMAVKICDGGPVLYKQTRLTIHGKEFKIWKFRSMCVDAEKDGIARMATENDKRITPVGRIIRTCRVDELPQFFNIIHGDMSLVGPRPERPEMARAYVQQLPAFDLRLQVKAGLTGYAQVYGRYNTQPKDKLKMDLMYIQNMGFLEDLKICLYTLKILFAKRSALGVPEEEVDFVTNEEQDTISIG